MTRREPMRADNQEHPESTPQRTAPTVSIGMPVYNGGEMIAVALESLLGQSFEDFELIISDNASTDSTEDVCRSYAARDSRIRYIRQPANAGAAANFAFVLAAARGDFFMWAAADDRWEPTFLEVNLNRLTSDRYAGSVSRVTLAGKLDAMGTRPLIGDVRSRLRQYLAEPAGNSRFYGVFRTAVIAAAVRSAAGSYIAADWAIMAALLMAGEFAECEPCLLTRSAGGTSSSWRRQIDHFGVSGLGRIFPLLPFTLKLPAIIGWRNVLSCADLLLILNVRSTRSYAQERRSAVQGPREQRDRAASVPT